MSDTSEESTIFGSGIHKKKSGHAYDKIISIKRMLIWSNTILFSWPSLFIPITVVKPTETYIRIKNVLRDKISHPKYHIMTLMDF